MAITVGTDTYISVADANTYLASQGLDPLDSNLDEQLLRRATLTLDRSYGRRWIGMKSLSTQPLLWPRFVSSQFDIYQYNAWGDRVAWTSSTIPTELGQATAELALQLQNAEETGFEEYSPSSPLLKSKTEKIGDLSVSEEYATRWKDSGSWAKVETILSPLLDPNRGGASISLSRGA